jgi:DNA polymerase III subunit delta
MPIVKNETADSFVAAPPADMRAFLLHGTDDSLAFERSRALEKALRTREGAETTIVRIEGDKLISDPDSYTSDLYGGSLFGGARILAIHAGGRDLGPALEPLVKNPAPDLYVVVEAANLKKDRDVLLRDLFGSARHAAAIECKPEDRASLGRLIEEEARCHDADVTAEARAALMDLLGPDRLVNRHELEKLFLYKLDAEKIGVEDVEAIVAGHDRSPLDEILDKLLAGEAKSLDEALASFSGDSPDLQSFPFRMVWRLLLLVGVAEEMSRGQSFQQALRDIGARVPYSSLPALQKQAESWRPTALRRLIPALVKYLARSRQYSRMSAILLERFLWNLTASSR